MIRLALLITITTLAAMACTASAEPPRLERPATPADSAAPSFRILWAGDTLLADAAQPLLDRRGYDWPFARLAGAPQADFTLINLEGPITIETEPWDPDQRWSYQARPAAAQALADAGIDAAGLANNHALDRGPQGLTDTRETLAAVGIASFGGGRDAAAKQPLLIETPHGIVGVVGFGPDKGFGRLASAARTGWLAPTATAVRRGIALAHQAGARWVVAFVHWGENYAPIDAEQRRTAARFAAAGYDLLVGHGSHTAQPIELLPAGPDRTMPALYSLGNFVFGTPGRYTTAVPGVSLLLTTVVGPNGLQAELRCLLTNNDEVAFQPRLCPSTQARQVLGALHPDIELEEDIATLRWN